MLWFGPSFKDLFEHNWYGNVSFIITLDKLVSRFGPNFYYLDKQEFPTHTASRVVLSKRSLSLTKVDISLDGAPLKRVTAFYNTHWSHVSKCESSLYGVIVPHKLEIGIEVSGDDCSWIYAESKIEANSHFLANTDGVGFSTITCHRYNTFGNLCPYNMSKEMSYEKLCKDYPNFLM